MRPQFLYNINSNRVSDTRLISQQLAILEQAREELRADICYKMIGETEEESSQYDRKLVNREED